ncbi:hypothetical protein L2E82_27194 [Cichorium intybus]|uniref:Uncharacterized protein n=1 Tax=Cichorium intybus TaxID=13427 RepID=A0ACB9CSA7_CICIN|nr:hypothetical protein L2E82_27194 [Cichorium intybus]
MDHRKNTQMMQIPTHQQYLGNGVPFRSLTPSVMSDGHYLSASESQNMSFNLPPSVDVDQSLSNLFSLLNFSPATFTDRQPFIQRTRGGQINSSVGVGEGFVHPIDTRTRTHSHEGFTNPFTVDPRHYHYHRRCNNTNAFQQHCSSGFDHGFDFDQKAPLGSKKFLYSTQQLDSFPRCSSNHTAAISDQTFLPINDKSKFQRSDEHLTPSYNDNLLYGVPFQPPQFLSSSSSLKQLRGRIYALAKDQNGCRILQAMFERPTSEEVEIVFSEVVDCITDLMKDQFGNYLVQKLVALCNDDQKMQLLLSLTKIPTNIILVCMNPHGTRAVQKLLENLKDPFQVKLAMNALHRGATTLANDPNGHHVIQYCLVHFHSDIIKPILTEIADKCYKVATDRSGCCVLQACVEHSRGEVRTRLVAEIMANSVHLAEDPFGNYVLQHMVGLNIPVFTTMLVRQLRGNFASLSCNKYGSNVVEKCLNESGEDVSTQIILELIRSPNSSLLLVDPYANFVIQSALKVSKGFAQDCLRGLISKNMSSMRSNLYGKKILEKLEKRRGSKG